MKPLPPILAFASIEQEVGALLTRMGRDFETAVARANECLNREIAVTLERGSALDREVQTLLRRISETPEGVLFSSTSTPAQRELAASALAMRLSIVPRKPAARRRLMRLARKAGKRKFDDVAAWTRSKMLVPAILRAAEDRYTPQPVRIGNNWIDGSRRPVIPMNLPWDMAHRWLRQKAARNFEEFLVGPKPRGELPLSVELRINDDHVELSDRMTFTPGELDVLRLARAGYDLPTLERSIQSLRRKIKG
jgi:hypothetical protein